MLDSHHGSSSSIGRSWQEEDQRRRRRRRRRIKFGNPSLSVFGGYVDTFDLSSDEDDTTTDDDEEQKHDRASQVDEHGADGGGGDDSHSVATPPPTPNLRPLHKQYEDESRGSLSYHDTIVAMIDVPPEQVPEGILNFVRAHRPYIEHVRIVITDDDSKLEDGRNDQFSGSGGEYGAIAGMDDLGIRRRSLSMCHVNHAAASNTSVSAPTSGNLAFGRGSCKELREYDFQTAANATTTNRSMIESIPFGRMRSKSFSTAMAATSVGMSVQAADEKKSSVDEYAKDEDDIDVHIDIDEDYRRAEALRRLEAYAAASDSDELEEEMGFVDEEEEGNSMSYLVLFQLSSPEAAEDFIDDLDGRPYTTLQEDVTCTLCRVSALKGYGGVSLMSPFFAPASIGNHEDGSKPNFSDFSSQLKSAAASTPKRAITKGFGDANAAVGAVRETLANNTPSPPHKLAEGGPVGRRARSPITAGFVGGGGGGAASEAHNCAVCLDRLETAPGNLVTSATASHTVSMQQNHQGSGIITTVCNHTFHIDCLLQWQDSPCPVCRFDHSGLDGALSQCHVCGTTEHNYVCLICGVVSCGGGSSATASADDVAGSFGNSVARGELGCAVNDDRNQTFHSLRSDGDVYDADTTVRRPLPPIATGHARKHYDETLHAYALDTETQHVWDFAGQGYVHRLIQNKEDGKLVEINDPMNTSSQERTLSPGLSDAQEESLLHRKLEGFASRYYTVLKSQLEQQRMFYEAQLEEIKREHDQSFGSRQGRTYAQDLISALKQEKNQVEQRCVTLRRKLKKVLEDMSFLKNMNESLEGNKEPLRRQIMEAQRQRAETKDMLMKCLPPLEARLAMLFTQLEGGNATVLAEDGGKKPAAT